jgi:large subunit ribosomal protein L20
MVKIKHAVATRRRKKRLLKKTKGSFGQRSTRYQQAKNTLIKAMTYAYRDRRVKKREFRRLWILRLNAACREAGIPYSRFIKGLTEAKVAINRKMLSELAIHSPKAFEELVKVAKGAASPAAKKTAKTTAAAKT